MIYRREESVFLYPDLLHGIKGQFDNNGVVTNKGHRVTLKRQKGEIVKELEFNDDKIELNSDVSTKTHLNSEPMKRDPYEETMIDVKKSTIEKAGDGVFLIGKLITQLLINYQSPSRNFCLSKCTNGQNR